MSLDELDNIEVAEAIDRYVRGEKIRAIVKRRLIDEICFEPLAEEFDVSVPHIKRLYSKGVKQLYERGKFNETERIS